MVDTIVVGAGIIGQAITNALRKDGHEVVQIDCGMEEAGTPPSAYLMFMEWNEKYGEALTKPAMKQINDLFGLKHQLFRTDGGVRIGHRIEPPRPHGVVPRTVKHIHRVGHYYEVLLDGNSKAPVMWAEKVVVAAGMWTQLLVPQMRQHLTGKAGMACLWQIEPGEFTEAKMTAWAPYKQLMAFERSPGKLYVSDGTAVLPQNWTEERSEEIVKRCAEFVGLSPDDARRMYGIRPFIKKGELNGKPCVCEEVDKGLWVATGGYKSGTLAAGWCAHTIRGALQ